VPARSRNKVFAEARLGWSLCALVELRQAEWTEFSLAAGEWRILPAEKGALIKRLENVDRKFLQAELAELDIQAGWDDQKKNCLDTTRSLVNQIP
jgi:hypothetical protein